jgi:ABC-type nitrate/sulfonate/bicarbonate transport system substrate-binding protein
MSKRCREVHRLKPDLPILQGQREGSVENAPIQESRPGTSPCRPSGLLTWAKNGEKDAEVHQKHLIRTLALAMILPLLFTLAFTACERQPEKSVQLLEKITIAYPTTPLTALFHIAFVKGFFSVEGLEVTPQPHEFGRLALHSLLEGKADLAAPADTPIMFAVSGGKKIYTIAVIATSNKSLAIVAKKDRRISVPEDLVGKTIGAPLRTTGDFFLDSFLTMRGITKEEVNIVDLKPGEMFDALMEERVDAVSIWNPTLLQLRKELGNVGIIFYDQTIYSEIFCLSASQEFVRKHPETIRKVIMALIRAERFVKENPEESRSIVAEFIKMDKAILDEIWDSFDFKVTLSQSLLVSLEDQTRWAQQNGLIDATAMPNYLDFIYFDGLQSVRPEALSIIR